MIKKFFTLKKILLTFISIIFFIYFLIYLNNSNPKIFNFIKNKIDYEIRQEIKKFFLFVSYYKKENLNLEKSNKQLSNSLLFLNNELIALQQQKNLVNEVIFPQTQLIKLKLSKIKLDYDRDNRSRNKVDDYKDGKFVTPFYIESIADKVITITYYGKFIAHNNYKDIEKKFDSSQIINTNLPNNITIYDTLVFEKKIFVSYAKRDKSCNFLKIVYADIDFNFLKFKDFYIQGENDKNKINEQCNESVMGGRMVTQDIGKYKKYLFLTSKDLDSDIKYKQMKDQYGLNITEKYMVINRINFLDGKSEIFSTGHRNPQGLYVSKNIILSTEHGPRGGDEINRIFKGKNYGWPVASYGETYNENYSNKDQFNYKKNHYNLGFEEPLFAFTPSIGITQILPVNVKFSERWENSFLIGSLRAQSLYRAVFDHNFTRVINFEKILISNRIRDINYSPQYNFFILALEDEDGSIGILQVDNN